MDPKYRVSIPPDWRPVTGEILHLLSSFTHDMPMIKVLTKEAFQERLNRIETSTLTHAEKDELRGTLAMMSRPAILNDQGKLLIPKDLSEEVGLLADTEIVLAGRNLHFEVWNKASHAKAVAIERSKNAHAYLGVL